MLLLLLQLLCCLQVHRHQCPVWQAVVRHVAAITLEKHHRSISDLICPCVSRALELLCGLLLLLPLLLLLLLWLYDLPCLPLWVPRGCHHHVLSTTASNNNSRSRCCRRDINHLSSQLFGW